MAILKTNVHLANRFDPPITPYFGRAWSLTIIPNKGKSAGTPIVISTDDFGLEALRIEFDIVQYAYGGFWKATFIIYNADGIIPETGINLYDSIIQEGDTVIFCAGYRADVPRGSVPPVIFYGPIFYTQQDRIDVVDKRLIISCLFPRILTTNNFIAATIPALAEQFTQARFIAENSVNPIPISEDTWNRAIKGVTTPTRGATQLPRAKTYFGTPHQYLAALADQNNLQQWYDSKGWQTDTLQTTSGEIVGAYAPLKILNGAPRKENKVNYTLIGQPEQTSYGVNFRILLDPAVQVRCPLIQVVVQKQYVKQAPINYPNERPPKPLNDFDQYVVIGTRFFGDTRGNPWYVDVTGIANVLNAIEMLGENKTASPNKP